MSETSMAAFPAEELWDRLGGTELYTGEWPRFRHRDQGALINRLAKETSVPFRIEEAGYSLERRVIWKTFFGSGTRRVLVWARQHGNEPDCTAALSIVMDFLLRSPGHPVAKTILDRLSLCVAPMINPDGVARFTRQNAVGIDLNRDAVALSCPEARVLKGLADEFEPEFGFNLHDMSPRKATADGDLVALAFQAGPFEPGDTDNETRLKAKAVIGQMAETARRYAPHNIAKYTADYMHRAFGDSMMRWGVACILIEAGGWFDDRGGDDFVIRLFALSLLSGLYQVATGGDQPRDGSAYAAIPFDGGSMYFDDLYEKGRMLNGWALPPVWCDVAVNAGERSRRASDDQSFDGRFEGLGDLADARAKTHHDATGKVIMPGVVGVIAGRDFGTDVFPDDLARRCLAAGVTTAAAAFGPFASAREREDFADHLAAKAPPLNLVALERVRRCADIVARHGLTEYAGLATGWLRIDPDPLMEFLHLFHPAHHSATNGEDSRPLKLQFVFLGARSPRKTHLHLVCAPLAAGEETQVPAVKIDDLRELAMLFLRRPDQITASHAVDQRLSHTLPIAPSPVAFSADGPSPTWLAERFRALDEEGEGAKSTLVNLMTQHMAKVLKLRHAGTIRMGHRADMLVIDEGVLSADGAGLVAPPWAVVCNGQAALRDGGEARTVRGVLHLGT